MFDLFETRMFGTVGEITAYAIGTNSCNAGDVPLSWSGTTAAHPVIAQNIYRLEDGRFEQIGMSWLKHGFQAAAFDDCGPCEDPGTSGLLGVGCSDPYNANLNGRREPFGNGAGGLGPRSEVDPVTGVFPFPYGTHGESGDAIFKRLQVDRRDIDPSLHPEAMYFGEGHYVTADDAAAGNGLNNVSYRPLEVGSKLEGGWFLPVAGVTQVGAPAIRAWAEADDRVELVDIDVPDDGRFVLGYRCTEEDGGVWHYEFALYNLNSHRSGQRFALPVPDEVTVTNVGFNDVDAHSGEPYAGTDWSWTHAGGVLEWASASFEDDPVGANALRWGTMYNFRFDADAPPRTVRAALGLYRPGAPDTVEIVTCGPRADCPADVDRDGVVGFADLLAVLAAWGPCPGCPEDVDDSGAVGFDDVLALLAGWGPCA